MDDSQRWNPQAPPAKRDTSGFWRGLSIALAVLLVLAGVFFYVIATDLISRRNDKQKAIEAKAQEVNDWIEKYKAVVSEKAWLLAHATDHDALIALAAAKTNLGKAEDVQVKVIGEWARLDIPVVTLVTPGKPSTTLSMYYHKVNGSWQYAMDNSRKKLTPQDLPGCPPELITGPLQS